MTPLMRTATRTGWYCYPWARHDAAATLDEMRAAGMSHVTIATSYHAGKFLQPRDPKYRVYFPEDGSVYFRARDAHFGRLKPTVASVTRDHDVLDEICRAGMLPVRGWTVLAHNSRLGWLHPETVACNAYGDPYYYSLCPAHPDVQDYAVALCRDLAGAYPLESLLLETPGWLTYDHGYHHEFAQIDVSGELGQLLGLCFCDSCTVAARAAGLDLASLRRAVAARCDVLVTGGPGDADHALDEALRPLHDWRGSVVTALCRRIREEVRREVAVRVISTCQRPHRTAFLEGMDLRALARVTDGLELPIYQPSPDAAADDVAYVQGMVDDPARLSVILRPGRPDMTSEAQLADTLHRLTAAGIDDISFYNFDLLPAASIKWVARTAANLRSDAHVE